MAVLPRFSSPNSEKVSEASPRPRITLSARCERSRWGQWGGVIYTSWSQGASGLLPSPSRITPGLPG